MAMQPHAWLRTVLQGRATPHMAMHQPRLCTNSDGRVPPLHCGGCSACEPGQGCALPHEVVHDLRPSNRRKAAKPKLCGWKCSKQFKYPNLKCGRQGWELSFSFPQGRTIVTPEGCQTTLEPGYPQA
eukprot:1161805-Pelagomonas_calceolata.AAC.9